MMDALVGKHLMHEPEVGIREGFDTGAGVGFGGRIGVKRLFAPHQIGPVQDGSRRSKDIWTAQQIISADFTSGGDWAGIWNFGPLYAPGPPVGAATAQLIGANDTDVRILLRQVDHSGEAFGKQPVVRRDDLAIPGLRRSQAKSA